VAAFHNGLAKIGKSEKYITQAKASTIIGKVMKIKYGNLPTVAKLLSIEYIIKLLNRILTLVNLLNLMIKYLSSPIIEHRNQVVELNFAFKVFRCFLNLPTFID
jgi:hypothetical protein